jgi:hypothetical protein
LIDDLIAGRMTLLRAETIQTVATESDIRTARLQSLSGDRSWDAQVMGPVPQSTGQAVGSSYLLRVSTELQPGSLLTAELHDDKHMRRGIKVPRTALLRWLGSTWLFIENQPNNFVRQQVRIDDCLDDACLVKDGLQAGQQVVTVGATLLLATENSHPAGD